jgi:ubiquinone/menaquinone biosynthesis C-methylase UbiE
MSVLARALENPQIFAVQQKICNNYKNFGVEFSDFLSKPALDIIDVGCSTGTCAKTVIDMKRHRYTGIDISPPYVAAASKRPNGGRFLRMDAREMSFPDESFDLAMYVGVLHHMDDETAKACLRETRRVLRRDGHILVAEPVFTPGDWLSTFFLSRDRGQYIRSESGYHALFGELGLVRERYFRMAVHRFCSFVYSRESQQTTGQ